MGTLWQFTLRRHRQVRKVLYGSIFLSLAVLAPLSHASTRTWSGAGANGNWSTSGNWSSTPVAGDDLVFPAVAARLANTNDFLNRGFNSITISGSNYVIQGNALSVSNNFSSQNV